MAVAQFASGRQRIPLDVSSLTVSSGGQTTIATNLYYCLQLENQAGINLLSVPVGPIAVGVGQRLAIALPSTIRKSGEGGFRFVISASTTNSLSSFSQLCCLDLYSLSGGVLVENPFPLTAVLSRDEHFKLLAFVANPESLPVSNDLLNGMVRSVASVGKIYEYNSNPIWLQNRDRVAASPGTWVRTGSFYTDIIATTDGGGCDRAIASLDPSLVKAPSYGFNGSSIPTTFWLQNRSPDAILSGTRIGFTITCSEDTITDLISSIGGMRVRFNGIVKADATLETNLTGAGLERVFQNRKTNLALPRDLQQWESYSVTCWFNAVPGTLGDRVRAGEKVKVRPFLYDDAGSFENSGLMWGDLVVPTENPSDRLRRVLPTTGLSVIAGMGSGCVDSFFFVNVPPKTVSDLPQNSSNLKIGINGSGKVYYLPGAVLGYEAIRAIVGTVNGTGSAGAFSAYSAVAANAGLTVTCNYPATNGRATIRSNYPDAIANSECDFNATHVTIYLQRQSSGEIRSFGSLAIVSILSSQQFTISNWNAGTIVGSIPAATNSFGFYQPGNCSFTIQPGAGNFPADNYRACFAFRYENTVSSITHDRVAGCIREMPTNLVDAIDKLATPDFDVTNASPSAIAKLSPVVLNGSSSVVLASSSSLVLSRVLGLAMSAIAPGAIGGVRRDGVISGTVGEWDAIAGTNGGLSPGSAYYLSATPGQITESPPNSGQFVKVGIAKSPTELILGIGDAIGL